MKKTILTAAALIALSTTAQAYWETPKVIDAGSTPGNCVDYVESKGYLKVPSDNIKPLMVYPYKNDRYALYYRNDGKAIGCEIPWEMRMNSYGKVERYYFDWRPEGKGDTWNKFIVLPNKESIDKWKLDMKKWRSEYQSTNAKKASKLID